jgi:hypothetical protein
MAGPYIGHEFLAGDPDFFGKGGTEHHDLLVVGGCPEDFLNIATHV